MAACNRNFKPGWKCIVGPHKSKNEPCGLVPRWWNWTKFARRYRKAYRNR